LRLFILALKSGNLRGKIGLERIGVNHSVDHGINSDSLRSWSKAIW
jgi:hypothetical protein